MNELFTLTSTFEDIGGWPGALLIAACGIIVVFIMLAMLALLIMVISKVVGAIEGKKPAAAPAAKAAPAVSAFGLYLAVQGLMGMFL